MNCDPCGKAIPAVSDLYAKYKDSSVRILNINIYDGQEKEIFGKYVQKYNLDYPILFSDKNSVFNQLEIYNNPTYIILDKDMKVINIYHAFGAGHVPLEIETSIQANLKD